MAIIASKRPSLEAQTICLCLALLLPKTWKAIGNDTKAKLLEIKEMQSKIVFVTVQLLTLEIKKSKEVTI